MPRFVGSFLLRAALFFALGYALWLPLQAAYTRLLAAAAGPILRLVDAPPLVTSISSQENTILMRSYLTGLDNALGAWSAETLGVFVLAPLVLVLASPVGRLSTRLCVASGVLALVFAVTVGIAVTQIQIAVDARLAEDPGITVHGASELATLQRLNDILHVVGMLALPAFVFLASYAAGSWLTPSADADRARGGRFRPAYAVPLGVVLAGLIAWSALAAVPTASDSTSDYHEGWAKVLRLNPDFAPAQVNVALHHEAEGRLDAAIELYRKAARSRPDLPGVHYNLGNALQKQQRHVEAAEAYRAVLRLEPGHGAAHRNLGVSLARLDRPCDAARHLELSTRLDASAASNQRLLQEIERLRSRCNPVP